MIRRTAAFLLSAALWPVCSYAQSNQSPNPPPTTQNSSASTPANTQPASTLPAKPKKVWTNDDVKSAGSVSVFGDPRNQKYTLSKPPDPATVARYKTNLQKLQAEWNDVNRKLQGYEDFAQGKPVSEGGRDLSHGYSRTPVDQQIVKLHEKKKNLEDQMDALYDAARKDGVDSGLLK